MMNCEEEISSKSTIGPDLNESRPKTDKKLYRQILLPNGLRAVLISDTFALGNQEVDCKDNISIEKESDEISDDDGEESTTCNPSDINNAEDFDAGSTSENEESDYEEEADDGLRNAAAALVVGVGSMFDPPEVQGLAHFLEHMLFMGTEKYPEENSYDAFLSKHGGSDNAYTEMEYTVYYLRIAQEKLFPALDMFAQFFINPLLKEDAAERELNSIESEFQLSKNSDQCRLQQLLCHTSGNTVEEHPSMRFSWGNLKSLRDAPKEQGFDVMQQLRSFYNKYYYAANMRLVVIGAYSLDVLQEQVEKHFIGIPPSPRELGHFKIKHHGVGSWEGQTNFDTPMANFSLPLKKSTLKKVYRIIPVRDRHTLFITWQVPSQTSNWRTDPCDYLSHLLGHEASGSILASLKTKSWATGCSAGLGSDGVEFASSHALFTFSFSLSKEGMKHYEDIVNEIFSYIGMLRYFCINNNLPDWIQEEIKLASTIAYQFADEEDPCNFAEQLADRLAPHLKYPPARLLDGREIVFDFDFNSVKDLLDNYLTPQNTRIDLFSSNFGRESGFSCQNKNSQGIVEKNGSPTFDIKTAGPPKVEPWFGTHYWCHDISEETINKWEEAARPRLPSVESNLSLPPKNPYIPKNLELKSRPPSKDGEHQLVNADEGGDVCGDGCSAFPPIPPELPECRLPKLVCDEQELQLWHLHDRKFERPIAELRLRLICSNANDTPLRRACADLMVLLCADAVTETSYLASVCDLGSSIVNHELGFTLRVHGFDDKALDLFMKIFSVLLSFRGRSETDGLPDSIKLGRFEACHEVLKRRYENDGLKASTMSSRIRVRCLCPFIWSSYQKSHELQKITVGCFLSTISEVMSSISAEVLYHGNVDASDAEFAKINLLEALKASTGVVGLSKDEYPKEEATKLPLSVVPQIVTCPAKDVTESNSAVEYYFQMGKDNVADRVMTDLLCYMMEEPLYDQLRTKDQFGYSVSCDSRWTCGVIGLCFYVISSSKSVDAIKQRIETFIKDYRTILCNMTGEEFLEHLVGLAKNKLEMVNSLSDECDLYWGEIKDFRLDWQLRRNEALELKKITKEGAINAFDKWFVSENTRALVVQVVGNREEGTHQNNCQVEGSIVEHIDQQVETFRESMGSPISTWGKIY